MVIWKPWSRYHFHVLAVQKHPPKRKKLSVLKMSENSNREQMLEQMRREREARLQQRIDAEQISSRSNSRSPDKLMNQIQDYSGEEDDEEPIPREPSELYQSQDNQRNTEDLIGYSEDLDEPRELADYKKLMTTLRKDNSSSTLNSAKGYKYPQERFYENAKRRDYHKKLYNKMIDQDIKSLANSKKINSKSEDILIKKLEENLSLAFMSVDQQESKVISFEQLGRVLFLMGLFEVIKYDEECQVVTEDFYTAERDDQIRRYDEMVFHEQLFNHLAFDGEVISDEVAVELAYSFLRIMMDPRKIKYKEHLAVIKDLMHSIGMNIIEDSVNLKDAETGEDIQVFPLSELLRRFYQLKESMMYTNKTGFLKPTKAEEYKEKIQKELTFEPQINPLSQVLDEMHVSKMKDELSSLRGEDLHSEQIDRVELLYLEEEKRRDKIREKQEFKKMEEMKECTFKPNLVKTSNYKGRKFRNVGTRTKQVEVVDRLYGSLREKYENYEEVKRHISDYKEQAELNECTFAPKINDYDPREYIYAEQTQENPPLGYHKAIVRMRYANEAKQQKKKMLDHIPKGENYERRKTEKVKIPTCARKRSFKKGRALVYLDINVAPGKYCVRTYRRTGRLGIYEHDNPCEKARSFAQAFQLNEEVEEGLCNLIQAYLEGKQTLN